MYGTGDLSYTDEHAALFIQVFRESEIGQRLVAEGLWNGDSLNKIQEAADTNDEAIRYDDFVKVARRLFLIGELKPKAAPVVEDNVERDKLGRPLSPKAIQWKRWEEWCNDPKTKMADINNLRRTDAKFAEFYQYQTNLRVNEEGVHDAVVAIGTAAVRQDTSIVRTADLKNFADVYRHMSSDDVRKQSSPSINPNGYLLFKMKTDECIAAGLL
jgi:hypothetical protein